jgi:hypothetical protein
MFDAAMRKCRSVLRERARLAYSARPGTKHFNTILARAYRVDFLLSCAELHLWRYFSSR